MIEDDTPVVSDWLDIELVDAQQQDVLQRYRAGWHVHLREPARADSYLRTDMEMRGANSARAGRMPMKGQQLATPLLADRDEVGGPDSCPAIRLVDEREMFGEGERSVQSCP